MRAHILTLLAALLLLPGCPGGGAASQDAYDLAKARGKLILGTNAGYDPFEVLDLKTGEVVGFDIDLAHEIGKDLGLAVEVKNTDFDGIIAELKTGKVDLVLSGMSITPEREKDVLFSRPYFLVGQVVVKRKGDARIKSWKDLDAESLTVAVEATTTGDQAVQRVLPKARRLSLKKIDMALQTVKDEKADAVVFDHPYLMKYLALQDKEGRLEGLWERFTDERIGVALRKDSPKLLSAVDATLARLEKSGELAALVKKHFPHSPPEKK